MNKTHSGRNAGTFCKAMGGAFMAWFTFSCMEIILKNCAPDPVYGAFNIFTVLSSLENLDANIKMSLMVIVLMLAVILAIAFAVENLDFEEDCIMSNWKISEILTRHSVPFYEVDGKIYADSMEGGTEVFEKVEDVTDWTKRQLLAWLGC